MQSARSSSANDAASAKRNRACENCSRAKAKCTPRKEPQSNQCSRCFRLEKQCTIRPRAVRKKRSPNSVSNSAQLEQKIESLVTLLSAAQGSVNIDPPDGHLEPPQDRRSLLIDYPWNNGSAASNNEPPSGNASSKSPEAPNPADSSIDNNPVYSVLDLIRKHWSQGEGASDRTMVDDGSFTDGADIHAHTPEDLLNLFRERYASLCPYGILAPNDTALELREKQPWLYRILLVIASADDRHYQIEAGRQIAIEISGAMIGKGDRSLDMLQSLLVYNVWSYYFSSLSPQSQSTAMLQLALALLFDLKLNRRVPDDNGVPAEIFETLSREKKRPLDERRALLFSYYLLSVLSFCIKKIDGLPISPYIEYSCQVLQDAAELDTDLILVACVKLQAIVESINGNTTMRSPSSDGHKAPLWMHTASGRSDIQNVLDSLPPNLQNNAIFRMSYYSAEILLYESSVDRSLFPTAFSSQRIDMLYACLLSAKSLLDLFLAEPSSSYFGFSIANLAQLGHACSTLFKLSLVEEIGWDIVYVRQTANIAAYLEQLALRFEQAGTAIDHAQRSPSKESFPTGLGRAMRRMKEFYEAKIAPEAEFEGRQRPPSFSGVDETMIGNGFDYLDDSYWQAVMADMSFMQQLE